MHPRTDFRERHQSHEYSDYEFKMAQDFAKRLDVELGEFLHCMVLFGSAVKTAHTTIYEKDIDVLIIINDMTKILNPEVVEAYRIIVYNTAKQLSSRFHVNTLKVSDFWDYVRNGDPLIVNILRDGKALLDKGLWEPVQALFNQGRVRPTQENVWVYYMRAPSAITSAKWHMLQACLDLYWAVIDASHALLISQGEAPISPKHISASMMQWAKKGKIHKQHAKTVEEFYNLSKQIITRDIKEISGAEYEEYRAKAQGFIDEMIPIVKEQKRV